jgi:type I restriction enzyme S subunit
MTQAARARHVWSDASVGELFQVLGGGTPSTTVPDLWSGPIPWITSADLHEDGSITPRRFISSAAVERSATNVVPSGSIIVATRVGLGKLGITSEPTAFSQDCQGLVVDATVIDPEFAALQLGHLVRRFHSVSRGTTIAGVTKTQLTSLRLAVPPLDQQREIVALLDEKLSLLRAAESVGATSRQKVQAFRTAYLQRTFLEPSDATMRRISDIGTVHIGATPARGQAAFWDGDIPWVSSGEIRFGRIRQTRETITDDGLRHSSTVVHPPGTVLLAMIGEGRTRGQSAILDIAAATNQNMAAVRVTDPDVLPEWLFYFLMANYSHTRQMGSGNNQPALNKARVNAMELPIPPQDFQYWAVNNAAQSLSVLDAVAVTLDDLPRRTEVLRRRLIAQALRLGNADGRTT